MTETAPRSREAYLTPLMPRDTVSHEGPDGYANHYEVVEVRDAPGFSDTLVVVRAEKTGIVHIFERETLYLVGSDD